MLSTWRPYLPGVVCAPRKERTRPQTKSETAAPPESCGRKAVLSLADSQQSNNGPERLQQTCMSSYLCLFIIWSGHETAVGTTIIQRGKIRTLPLHSPAWTSPPSGTPIGCIPQVLWYHLSHSLAMRTLPSLSVRVLKPPVMDNSLFGYSPRLHSRRRARLYAWTYTAVSERMRLFKHARLPALVGPGPQLWSDASVPSRPLTIRQHGDAAHSRGTTPRPFFADTEPASYSKLLTVSMCS